MPKQDYIIPIIKGGGKSGVKAFVNLRTEQVVKTGSWRETPNCLVSEYCQRPVGDSYGETWDRVYGRKQNGGCVNDTTER